VEVVDAIKLTYLCTAETPMRQVGGGV
jgi:hypothetical protein